nr:DUF21 domain-containing protein At4g33700 isoform X2 [Ciona intestinalis]XP_026696468.1 DUF21 domain-containing protein At4g33700 isoform X2 [Ciona intestinalis]XP_026696469.1 DUF21 domain-containing protein At4g33700 isoform X2 [Ciona intestinalis]|eukprot:XP_018673090.1 DUF21 domain-containing protein At4g33700 isoform X2 [Ciona intestinalis]
MTENITCSLETGNLIICNGVTYKPEVVLTYHDKLFWIYLGIYVALVLIAGLMSGLTMGLLSLDLMSLTVLSTDGKPNEQKHAKRILPLVKRHHLLLVTLLLSNAAAVESMPLFLDKISNPITAIVVSVTAVLIFGEVVPQALCTRYGLAIGSTLSPLVYALMFITLPISWPLAKILDCVLGKEHTTFFRRAELSALVSLHRTEGQENEEPLTADEVTVIKGALAMRDKQVKQVCTPMESVFSLDVNGVMDQTTMNLLLSKGHSRVPIYEGTPDNLIGLILVKNLIKIDPDANLPIREVFEEHKRPLLKVPHSTGLFDVLNLFQLGKSHMFIVVRENESGNTAVATKLEPEDEVIGLITLEDVMEELIQEEIVDETDVYVDVHRKIEVAKSRRQLLSTSSNKFARQNPKSNITDVNVDSADDTQPLLR